MEFSIIRFTKRNDLFIMDNKTKRTKTFYFLFPLLGNFMSEFPNIINCYLGDVDKTYTNSLLALFKWSSTLAYSKFEDSLKDHPYFIESYEPTRKHTMFVFKIPNTFKDNYNKFLTGKYSQLSNEYKIHILSFFSTSIQTQTLKAILYKEKERREKMEQLLEVKISKDIDLLDLINMKSETFNIKSFKYDI